MDNAVAKTGSGKFRPFWIENSYWVSGSEYDTEAEAAAGLGEFKYFDSLDDFRVWMNAESNYGFQSSA